MRHQKKSNRKSKPVVSHAVVKIESGQKLLWQKNPTDFGFDLNVVDASVQN